MQPMRPKRWTVLQGDRALSQDAAVCSLVEQPVIRAGPVPVIVDSTAWNFLNALGVSLARRDGSRLDVRTFRGLHARLALVEDPYHRMRLGEAPNMAQVGVELFAEWLARCRRAASATEGFVYARRSVVFGFHSAGLAAFRLSRPLPVNTAASARALEDFAEELKGRSIGDAGLADGAAVVCGEGFATQMALAFEACPTAPYEMAVAALGQHHAAPPVACVDGARLRAAIARIAVILDGLRVGDDHVTVTALKASLRLSHDDAMEKLPAEVSSPWRWVSSIRALQTLAATTADVLQLAPIEVAGGHPAVLIRSPDRREAVVLPIRHSDPHDKEETHVAD